MTRLLMINLSDCAEQLLFAATLALCGAGLAVVIWGLSGGGVIKVSDLISNLKKLEGFWIRKNRNVQVRCLVNNNLDEVRRFTLCFRNGHQRYISKENLLSEFINLDDFLERVTKGSEWLDRKSAYLKEECRVFVVCEVCLKRGVVIYQPRGATHSGRYQTTIGHFDVRFQSAESVFDD